MKRLIRADGTRKESLLNQLEPELITVLKQNGLKHKWHYGQSRFTSSILSFEEIVDILVSEGCIILKAVNYPCRGGGRTQYTILQTPEGLKLSVEYFSKVSSYIMEHKDTHHMYDTAG